MVYKLSDTQQALINKNTIDLAGPINSELGAYLREALMQLTAKDSPDIRVYFTSGGGASDVGQDMYDMLRLYQGKKTGIVLAYARSAAAIILQACDERQCAQHANILIHHVGLEGRLALDDFRSAKKMKKKIEAGEIMQSADYQILKRRTGRTIAQIRKVCSKDRDLDAKEALEFGLIDKIV